ncbi:glyoxalase/Bleomycin resistance protein/Dioxygenase superfamily protein [Colletotrichum nymphaeae SA-01]|uniref:Glyoxalase/Bleomycin resistance protein/Dioxygenase superfamily protein n=1 Tax=Colletotrichum nymphaeae SA-01 TaxID=1460502 RepID=A0A135T550_9PEZI|nr:glyoxalase/Bleomycin resistance protein/Dioxygenase superfamily protein [Colletotrichum nymphaeae SA-01]
MTQTPSPPSPIEIAHLGLRTPNPTPLVTFYQTLLNAHVVLQNNYISVLTWDKEHHRLAILHQPPPSTSSNETNPAPGTSTNPSPSTGLDHIALKFASLKDLALVYHAGKAGGIEPHLCLDHGVTTSLYYRDPDGNQIETMIEKYDNPEDVWMRMNSLDPSNTRGVKFDPEELLQL